MMGKRKVSIFSILALIIGLSGLGLGVYSLYNYQQLVIQVEPPKPLARAFLNLGYAVSSGSYMVVNFDVLDYDETGDFNLTTDKFICPTSGYYFISGMVTFGGMQDGEAIYALVFIEGYLKSWVIARAAHSTILSASFTDIVYLNEGDYVELQVYHTGSGSRDIFGDSVGIYTYLTIAATDILN